MASSSVFIDGFVNPYNKTPRGVRDDNGDAYIMEDEFCFYESKDDSVTYVGADEAGRVDKIAFREYGNPLYDWVIMRRNGIHHPSEVKSGMKLYIPRFQNLVAVGSPLVP